MQEHTQDNSFINCDEMEISSKAVFKDDNAHPYLCDCHDGIAYCKRVDCEENEGKPETVMMEYPMLWEILGTHREREVRDFSGIPDGERLTPWDVALRYGKVVHSGLTPNELNLIDNIARGTGMDCWLGLSNAGSFKDLETGRKMSPKTAVKQMLEGFLRDDWDCLSADDKWTLLQIAGKLM